MSSVYESIMTGLNEAIADAENGMSGLERHTVELPDAALRLSGFPVGKGAEVFPFPTAISPTPA